MPSYGKCAGEEFAAFAGMGILSSYLLLFISFYFATYKKAGQKGRKRSDTATRAAIDMSKMEVPTVDKAKGVIIHANGSVLNGHPIANGNGKASGRKLNGPMTRSRRA
jgi:fatty acid elongase 3